MIRATETPGNYMMDIQPLSLIAETGLVKTAALASVTVPIACRFGLFLPIKSTPIMLGRAALPRGMTWPANIPRLPSGVTRLTTEPGADRRTRSENGAAKCTLTDSAATGGPTRFRAISGGQFTTTGDFKFSAAGSANQFNPVSRGAYGTTARDAALPRAKSGLSAFCLKHLVAFLTYLLHAVSIPQNDRGEEQYIADIRERLAFYEGGGAHSMQAKNRNRKVEHGPLFEEVAE